MAYNGLYTPSAISLSSPRTGVKQLPMKQQSPQAKICVACRHLSLTVSARGSQISLAICALGYGMLRLHLKAHTCARGTLLLLQGCSPLRRARSWPGYSSWGQTATSQPLTLHRLTFASCFGPQKWGAELNGLLATRFKWLGLSSVLSPLFFHPWAVGLKTGAAMKHKLACVYSSTCSAVTHNARVDLTKSMTISCGSKALRQNTRGQGGQTWFPLHSLSL